MTSRIKKYREIIEEANSIVDSIIAEEEKEQREQFSSKRDSEDASDLETVLVRDGFPISDLGEMEAEHLRDKFVEKFGGRYCTTPDIWTHAIPRYKTELYKGEPKRIGKINKDAKDEFDEKKLKKLYIEKNLSKLRINAKKALHDSNFNKAFMLYRKALTLSGETFPLYKNLVSRLVRDDELEEAIHYVACNTANITEYFNDGEVMSALRERIRKNIRFSLSEDKIIDYVIEEKETPELKYIKAFMKYLKGNEK